MDFAPGPGRPSPADGELHVWSADLDAPGWPSASGLPAEERVRASRFLRSEVRARWVASRWVLRNVLGRYLDREPGAIALVLGEHGKPQLAEAPERLDFNLSHSGSITLVAVCGAGAVGVDVEKIEMRKELAELAERALQPEDAAAVRAVSGAARVSAFYERWTRHEASLKCLGHGLSAARGDAPVTVRSLRPEVGYAAAVAVRGEELPPLRCWTLMPPR